MLSEKEHQEREPAPKAESAPHERYRVLQRERQDEFTVLTIAATSRAAPTPAIAVT